MTELSVIGIVLVSLLSSAAVFCCGLVLGWKAGRASQDRPTSIREVLNESGPGPLPDSVEDPYREFMGDDQ